MRQESEEQKQEEGFLLQSNQSIVYWFNLNYLKRMFKRSATIKQAPDPSIFNSLR